MRERHDGEYCDVFHRTIEVLGRRWNGVIIRALMGGSVRFCEIRGVVPGLSDRLLSQRLRELENEGLLRRTGEQSDPGGGYKLTEKGRALGPVLDAVSNWAADWSTVQPASREGDAHA